MAIAVTAVLGAAVACVLADPPPIDPLGPPTRPTILTQSVAPPAGQYLTADPVNFQVPVSVDPDQPVTWRVFQDLAVGSTADPIAGLDNTDDGGTTDLAEAGNTVRVITFSLPTSLDFSTCHRFKFVVAAAFDLSVPSAPADLTNCPSCGDEVTWYYQPVPDCMFDDAAPPTQMPEAGDGASE